LAGDKEVKTVALKDIKTGGFTMCRLTGFGSISSDDRADYTSENKFTEYKNLADGKFGTKVSLGNFKTSLDLKETRIVTLEDDKVVKDSKISALEDDKAVKDTKIANLESDKNDKDTRVAALETDKNQKDTKMSTMESDMEALTNRVTALETLGIKGISNAVSWTNLTEINLSGEKLVNGDFSSVTNNAPTNWSVSSAIGLDSDKLAEGIIKGDGGAVSLQQVFSNPITTGTKLVAKVTRTDIDGVVRVSALRANGSPYGSFNIPFADGYVEFETTETTYGLRLSTAHGTREVSSISLFQGAVSGGTVQAYAGGGLEKISGADGFNAGASSSQKIDGNSDGYVQFQIAQTGKDIKIGLVYADVDYADADPFEITFSGTDVSTDGSVRTTYAQGDFFRIRHYASSNEIKYQRKQTVYSQNPNFVFETATDSNYSYPIASRPKVISLDGTGNLTIGQLYEVSTVKAGQTQALYLKDLDGNGHGYHGQATRGIRFEAVEEAGQDYVTFYTEPTLTNGSDLYVDTSFHSVGARINDVTIVT
jgi:hypothetical protein